MAAKSGDTSNSKFGYILAVNDKKDLINLVLDISEWNVKENSLIVVESVGKNHRGEVSSILKSPQTGIPLVLQLDAFTLIKITIQNGQQNLNRYPAKQSCYACAGSLSSTTNCVGFFQVGTSNSRRHETTCVGILRFALEKDDKLNANDFKALLELTVSHKLMNSSSSNQSILLVLGFKDVHWNENNASWSTLSEILTPLTSNTLIDSIGKNFINWSGNANISIVGHITVRKDESINQFKHTIDVTDYVKHVLDEGGQEVNFLIYRPFRHGPIKSSAGSTKPDDLGNGTLISFFGLDSEDSPSLKVFN